MPFSLSSWTVRPQSLPLCFPTGLQRENLWHHWLIQPPKSRKNLFVRFGKELSDHFKTFVYLSLEKEESASTSQVACASAVHAYKMFVPKKNIILDIHRVLLFCRIEGNFSSQGKLGAAILTNHETKDVSNRYSVAKSISCNIIDAVF